MNSTQTILACCAYLSILEIVNFKSIQPRSRHPTTFPSRPEFTASFSHSGVQGTDSLASAMEAHGTFNYEIKPQGGQAQSISVHLFSVSLDACKLAWRVQKISADTSRIASTSNLSQLDEKKLRIAELRSTDRPLKLTYSPSVWELDFPVLHSEGSALVRSEDLETGMVRSLRSLYLLLDSEKGANLVASLLSRRIQQCKNSGAP